MEINIGVNIVICLNTSLLKSISNFETNRNISKLEYFGAMKFRLLLEFNFRLSDRCSVMGHEKVCCALSQSCSKKNKNMESHQNLLVLIKKCIDVVLFGYQFIKRSVTFFIITFFQLLFLFVFMYLDR